MKGLKTTILFGLILAAFASCHSPNSPQVYEYVSLKTYKFDTATIQPGAGVRILAFSGGPPSGNDTVYYYQFIVLDQRTGDTARILTPLISFDTVTAAGDKTYVIPSMFDGDKKVFDAFYESIGSDVDLILETAARGNESKNDTADLSEMVVINKSMAVFGNLKYKTAIGVLNFKKRPW